MAHPVRHRVWEQARVGLLSRVIISHSTGQGNGGTACAKSAAHVIASVFCEAIPKVLWTLRGFVAKTAPRNDKLLFGFVKRLCTHPGNGGTARLLRDHTATLCLLFSMRQHARARPHLLQNLYAISSPMDYNKALAEFGTLKPSPRSAICHSQEFCVH